MTSMQSGVAMLLVSWLLTGMAQAQTPAVLDVVLIHGFRIPNGDSWGKVSILLSNGGWRVGDPGGPLASQAQLRLVLRALVAVEIGGRCTGWLDGATAYPCGFSVREIDWAGRVEPRYAAIAVDQQSVAAARGLAEPVLKEHASSVPRSPRLDRERFVALHLPADYLGDQGKAFGESLRFEIRALSNVLVPSKFDRSSGLAVLRARLVGERG